MTESDSVPSVMRLSSQAVAPLQRREWIREVMAPIYDVRSVSADGRLEGAIETRLCHEVLVGRTRFSNHHCVRDQRVIAASGLDYVMLQLFDQGELVGQSSVNGDFAVHAGDMAIFDMSLDYEFKVAEAGGQTSTLGLVLPRQHLDPNCLGSAVHGKVLSAHSPLNRLLARCVTALEEEVDSMNMTEAMAVQEMVLEMVNSRLRSVWEPLHSGREQALRTRICTYIHTHLAEPGLDVQVLQARFGLSRARLYRLFVMEGGVVAYVRNRRLDQCFREIVSHGKRLHLTELLYRWGFSSDQQFLRAFRKRFGITPSQLRQQTVETPYCGSLEALHNHLVHTAAAAGSKGVRDHGQTL